MKKVLFIGNRRNVWAEIRLQKALELVLSVAPAGSYLAKDPGFSEVSNRVIADRNELLKIIEETEFDLLISNGCPYVLPVSKLKRTGQLFINVHPSLLPELRGKHAGNGVFLLGKEVAGATMHYMDDGVDTGNIIAQRQIDITPDLDLGLLYECLFQLEGDVFRKGMRLLEVHDYQYDGFKQSGTGSTYSRAESDMIANVGASSREALLKRIRSFGIGSQGLRCDFEDRSLLVFDAETLEHTYVTALFEKCKPGTIAFEYDGKLIVRCADGLIKIKSYREVPLNASKTS